MSEEKKLTDEEIVKAYELCVNDGAGCAECPYSEYAREGLGYCNGDIEEDVLDLINRQKAEIERLTGVVNRLEMADKCGRRMRTVDQKEIAELQKQVDELNKKIIARESVFHNLVIVEKDKSVKLTTKEILILAEDYNCGYENDMDNFILALKEKYGVEVE